MFRTIILLCLAGAAQADIARHSVVLIACETPKGSVAQSTGAIVSADGHVLISRHGSEPGWRCEGRRGESGAMHPLEHIADSNDSNIDATLWRFAVDTGRDYVPLHFVPLDATLKKREIFAAGFPKNSPNEISWRRGVISTTEPVDGLIEN